MEEETPRLEDLPDDHTEAESVFSPFAYCAALHRLMDGGLTDLSVPAQRLYTPVHPRNLRPGSKRGHDRLCPAPTADGDVQQLVDQGPACPAG